MPVRLFQPYPSYRSPLRVPPEERVSCPVPVFFIRYRYPHHSAASGYDRLCDYVGETIGLSRTFYWLGETVLRPVGMYLARAGGHFEYSRYDFVLELEAMRHFLRHWNSVYHFVYAEKSYYLMCRLAGRNGNRLVGTVHHPPEHIQWLFRSTDHFRRLDLVIVVSRAQLAYWTRLLGEERVRYVPYAVDTTYFSPSNEERDISRLRLIFVGHHERDFDLLAKLVPRLLAEITEAELVMISRDARCGEIAASHPRAHWKRRVSDREYLSLLQSADLMILPLRRSTTCTAVLEALACGVPVVTTQGGIEDYLSNKCSRVVPPGDVDGMLECCRGLLRDQERLAAMRQAARGWAMRFSWRETARKMVALYAGLFGEEATVSQAGED